MPSRSRPSRRATPCATCSSSSGMSSRRSRSGGSTIGNTCEAVVEVVAEASRGRLRRPGRGWSPRSRARRRAGCAHRRRARTRAPAARAAAWPAPRAAARRPRRGTACRRRPARSGRGAAAIAPVNAPFSWPNSSLSTSSRGSAAQLTLTSGRSRRALCVVDRARHQLLAGAGLARDQHRANRSAPPARSARARGRARPKHRPSRRRRRGPARPARGSSPSNAGAPRSRAARPRACRRAPAAPRTRTAWSRSRPRRARSARTFSKVSFSAVRKITGIERVAALAFRRRHVS